MGLRARRADAIRLLTTGAFAASVGAACASILGYDDLGPRPDDTTDATLETEPDVPAEVSDTRPDAGTGFRPPARPAGSPTPSGKGRTLWIEFKTVRFGTIDLAGKSSSDAWKDIGYDIDGTCTGPEESKGDIGTCKKTAGAPAEVLTDGTACRDNNFGSRLMQLIKFARFEEETNLAIANGNNVWLLRLDDLDDGDDDPYVLGRLYRSSRMPYFETRTGEPPKFDGTDVRDVAADSVLDHDLDQAKTTFTKGYVAKGIFVSGEPSKLDVTLPLDFTDLSLPAVGAVVTLELSKDHTTAGVGTLAGALPISMTDALVRPIAKSVGVCPGTPVYASVIDAIVKSADVYVDSPTLQDPTKTCNGLSVGMSFLAAPILPVTKVVDEPTSYSNKCADAG